MPELPEVETTRRGIEPHLLGRRMTHIRVYDSRLRWPVPADLPDQFRDACIHAVKRRGKYLLIDCAKHGHLLMHLGMSGSLRIQPTTAPKRKHDHAELQLDSGQCLRLHDPRRFGALLWFNPEQGDHPLLLNLGPEPLEEHFNADYLFKTARRRQVSIKALIMNSQVVVGVGNIYASEALFMAGIRPRRAAGRITRAEAQKLVDSIRSVLQEAITQGGTTLRDFLREDGSHGYFSQRLKAYGRANLPCTKCGAEIRQITQGRRSSYYCPQCQR
ncbi:DNA-(apurinic or apyrimidinic site) lyase [Ectothiorhodosinus mongolicus]|uniref:Formamidopyrimidine-DNA glycosylase n=1 Tax=Ectothiorhodosinus mongolicus TaxID=233100 RepID=A0A1R3VPR1_9GAMM|nr:bifunctional DNA-formamidopyrimidine glycosylase/DNA-(apurinic or apyrimidinic site) lyase [Ectothiorhodosinus mongolicus]ULX56652.1 bifunctional DNA-formamidopyrimidine glycosylase/DNA-(apurinic or apyrimidinic site) lyase [Ectothiorhodosinus mongolicus]SIT66669.1 DNA-(apurinic or apyrimidinic site) lyase [Ectothiorhodosinus mongolicus]